MRYSEVTAQTPIAERPYPYGPAEPTPYETDEGDCNDYDNQRLNEYYVLWRELRDAGLSFPEFSDLPCEQPAEGDGVEGDGDATMNRTPGGAVVPSAPVTDPASAPTAGKRTARRRPRSTVPNSRGYNQQRETREAEGVAGRAALEVAVALGALPLKVLATLAARRASVPLSVERCYRAVRGLQREGLLAVWTPREAGGLEPCPGLLKVVALTPPGAEACLARAITRRSDAASFPTKRRAVEQLVLSGVVLRRVASGWSAVDGPDALLRLAKYAPDREQQAPRRNWWVMEREFHNLFALDGGARLTALLPPEPGGIAAVLFGGSWTTRSCFEGDNRAAMAAAAPYAILCAALGTVTMRQLRKKRVGKRSQAEMERNAGRVTVERLPDKRGPAWRELWRELDELLTGEAGTAAVPVGSPGAPSPGDRVGALIDQLLR